MSDKALWMRWVSFQKLRDLFLTVAEKNCAISAKQLYTEAVRAGILLSERGRPLSPTTAYHYRTVLQRLGLIMGPRGAYCTSLVSQHARALLDIGDKGYPLTYEGKRALAEAVIANGDCRHWFFDLFLNTRGSSYDLESWIREGNPITVAGSLGKRWKGQKRTPVVLQASDMVETRVLDTADKVQAVLWGVRLWCTEQLEIADELFVLNDGYKIFPVRHPDRLQPLAAIKTILSAVEPESDWTTLRVPDLTLDWAPRLRMSARDLHEAFIGLRKTFPGLIIFVPTAVAFVTMVTPFERRDKAILSSYLRDPGGEYISHIRLHRKIWDSVSPLSELRR